MTLLEFVFISWFALILAVGYVVPRKVYSLGTKLYAISNLAIVVLYGLFTFTQIWLLFFASLLTQFTFLMGIRLFWGGMRERSRSELFGWIGQALIGHALYHVVAFVFMLPVAFLGWEAFYLGSLFILGFVITFPLLTT